jgi:hypothetical protein
MDAAACVLRCGLCDGRPARCDADDFVFDDGPPRPMDHTTPTSAADTCAAAIIS